MSAWIMSIVGVICLGILLEIVLPAGQTAKYVKGAFSLLVVFVIAAPLPAIFNNDYKFSYDGSVFEVDEEYVNSTYAIFAEGIQERSETTLKTHGYEASVTVKLGETAPIKLKSIEVTVVNFKEEVGEAVSADVKRILRETLKCNENIINVYIKNSV